MLKKDFLQRQFEEFGKVLAVILGYRKQNDWERFEEEIDNAVTLFTQFNIKDLIEMGEASFESLIKESVHLKSNQIKILADLLYERSFVAGNNGNVDETSGLLKKALFLYEFYSNSLTENDYNLEVRYRMELIKKITAATV